MSQQPGEPKIIVDSDWKSQAQAEREKLAAAEREAKAKASAAAPRGPGTPSAQGAGAGAAGMAGFPAGGGGVDGEQAMPPADFQSLIGTLITQALVYMGGFPDPQTGRAVVSLEHAKFHIDLIGVFEEKTRGNLTPEEAADLNQALNELRMRFVEIARAIEVQMAKRAMGGAGVGGVGPGAGAIGLGGGSGMGMGVSGPGLR